MNWQHLIYFHKIVEAGSFSAASKQLYITSSALSKAIQNLESELEFPLFEKQGRKAILTEYGREFDGSVKKAIDILEGQIQSIHKRNGIVSGKLRVSGVWTMVGGYLPEKIRAFHSIHPKVTYSTKFMLTEQILQSVLSGQTELGFCGDYDVEGEYRQLERKHLFEEELVLILPPDHPMNTVKTIRPQDFSQFKNDGFISFRNVQSGGVYEAYVSLCRQCSEYPAISMFAQDDHAIIANVRAGMGIALVPCSKWLPLQGVHVIHFTENVPVRGQYMIWKKEGFLSPVARAFRELILQDITEEHSDSDNLPAES